MSILGQPIPLYLRRILAIGFHAVGAVAALIGAFLLRFDFSLAPQEDTLLGKSSVAVLAAYLIAIVVFRLYRGLWRYFTFRDCIFTALATLLAMGLSLAAIYLVQGGTLAGFPRSILLIQGALFLLWEVGGRGLVRLYRERLRSQRSEQLRKTERKHLDDRLLVIGDLEIAEPVVRALQEPESVSGSVVGVIDTSGEGCGSRAHGLPILALNRLQSFVKKEQVTTLVFVPPYDAPQKIEEILSELRAADLSLDYRVIPALRDITAGRVDVSRMRSVSIEDLLYRQPAQLDRTTVEESLRGKRVLVTGAGGSIGSEICRQVVALGAKSLTLFESSEFGLFEIDRELQALISASQTSGETSLVMPEIHAITGDIRRRDSILDAIDRTGGIDVIYHAAAYKHVHLMEKNLASCLRNNVLGTATVAAAAEERGVASFVLVSTDKAVRPTSIMGASKRLAERVIIERPASRTTFKAVRFGNVLGSSGSVIPIFRKQIAEGGPITVTSRQVTRYFMTIPEAVELVLAAGALAEDRHICVLEMGEPVKIDQLARRMIELSGFVPDKDIPIVYTGLRPGEKEYEELLTDDENVVETEHDRICVVKKSDAQADAPPVLLDEVAALIETGDGGAIRDYLHQRIPGSLLK